MTPNSTDTLKEFSAALEAQTKSTRDLVAEIRTGGTSFRSGMHWRSGVVVTSEQSLPKADSYEVVIVGTAPARAMLAGRDPGTNVAVLKLDTPHAAVALPAAAEPQAGAIALAFGADGRGAVAVRLGIVSAIGPEWRSRAGGKIDRRIALDIALSHCEDGGPVLDASGKLIGISTLGHRDTMVAIPPATIERSVAALLAHGRIDRGWLGVALQPVAIPDAWRAVAEEKNGLMVMSTVPDGPAAGAGLVAGDILLKLDGASATHVRSLAGHLGPDSVGRQVELSVVRAGAIIPLRAIVTARPVDG